MPWELEVARYVAPIGALLVTLGLIGEIVQALRSREWSRHRWFDHVIVCGLGRKGTRLALAYVHDSPVVAIELNRQSPDLQECRDAGIRVLTGSATSSAVLRRAGISTATRIVATLGNDGDNAKVLALARDLAQAERTEADDPLQVDVHIFDRELKARLAPIFERPTTKFAAAAFNIYETAAEELCTQQPLSGGDGPGARRIMMIGFGELAESIVLAIEARWSQLIGQSAAISSEELAPVITIIDREAKQKIADMRERNVQLWGIEFNALEMDVESVEFERGEFLRACAADLDAVFITFDDDEISVVTALTVAEVLEEELQHLPIFTRVQARRSGLASLVEDDAVARYAMIRPFSVLDLGCSPNALDAAEAASRKARITYDSDYDRLVVARLGELVDDQLFRRKESVEGVELVRRGGVGALIGYIVEPLAEWQPHPNLDREWNGPLWDVDWLALEAAPPGAVISAAIVLVNGQSTADTKLFDQAVGVTGFEAERLWRQCLAAGDPKAHYGLGYTLLDLGKSREAYAHLRRYTQLAPKNAWAWCYLGRAAEAIGDLEGARRGYERAIRVTAQTHDGTDADERLAAMDIIDRWSTMSEEEKVNYLFRTSDAIDKAQFLDQESPGMRRQLIELVEDRWDALTADQVTEVLLWGPEWRAAQLLQRVSEEDQESLLAEAATRWRTMTFEDKLERMKSSPEFDDIRYALNWADQDGERSRFEDALTRHFADDGPQDAGVSDATQSTGPIGDPKL